MGIWGTDRVRLLPGPIVANDPLATRNSASLSLFGSARATTVKSRRGSLVSKLCFGKAKLALGKQNLLSESKTCFGKAKLAFGKQKKCEPGRLDDR